MKSIKLYSDVKQCQDQSHADIDTILGLFEVGSPGVIIDFNGYFIDTGEGMEDAHIRFCKSKFCLVKDIAVLHTDVFFLIEEAFLLYTGHIENVQRRHG